MPSAGKAFVASITQRTDVDSSAVDILLIGEVDVHQLLVRGLGAVEILLDVAEPRERDADVLGVDFGPASDRVRRLADTIRAVEYRSYTIDYCPTCQTGGKVLADNTTSKFLK